MTNILICYSSFSPISFKISQCTPNTCSKDLSQLSLLYYATGNIQIFDTRNSFCKCIAFRLVEILYFVEANQVVVSSLEQGVYIQYILLKLKFSS